MPAPADAISNTHDSGPPEAPAPVRTPAERRERIRRVSHERLGYDHLRPGQEAAIQSVLAGRVTLAVMPTGTGESAI